MRARNIKPGFFDNEVLGSLSVTSRLLFIGLWCLSDKEGLIEYRPLRIKAKIFPYDSLNVVKFLEELSQSGFIIIWTDTNSNGQIIEIPNFVKHQSPHPNEKTSNLREILSSSENFKKLHEISGQITLILGKRNPDIMKPDIRKGVGTFGNVFLSEDEEKKLITLFNGNFDEKINNLSEYLASSGKKYKSHYATILNWDRRDKSKGKIHVSPPSTSNGKIPI